MKLKLELESVRLAGVVNVAVVKMPKSENSEFEVPAMLIVQTIPMPGWMMGVAQANDDADVGNAVISYSVGDPARGVPPEPSTTETEKLPVAIGVAVKTKEVELIDRGAGVLRAAFEATIKSEKKALGVSLIEIVQTMAAPA